MYADTMAQYTLDAKLTQLTLRIIAKTMYGVDLDAQTAAIGRLMNEILSVAQAQLSLPFMLPQWVPTTNNRRQAQALAELETLLRGIIAERQLMDECITLFVAGHETTAAALTWAWVLLCQHPESYAALTDELQSTLGSRTITFDDITHLPRLNATIKEAMRLYPPAPSFGRTVLTPFTIEGHEFPQGAIVLIAPVVTHRRADLWEDPLTFKPERFLNGEPTRYTYPSFGAGPRVCMGNMFAMMEASIILATMAQHVDIQLLNEDIRRHALVTLRPQEPVRVAPHIKEISW